MNRSIMVVICDFIILSMLSMMPGLFNNPAGGHLGSTGTSAALDAHTSQMIIEQLRMQEERLRDAREALLLQQRELELSAEKSKELDQLTEELVKTRANLEFLQKQLALTPEEMGELTKEDLQKHLEEARAERIKVEIAAQDKENALQNTIALTQEELEKLRKEYLNTAAELSNKQQALKDTEAKLSETGNKLQATEQQFQQTSQQLRETVQILTSKETELAETQAKAEIAEGQVREGELSLSFAQGKLNATEKELAETKSKMAALQKSMYNRDLELAEANKQVANLQNVLKNAVSDLTNAKEEFKRLSESNIATTEELNNAQQEITRLESECKIKTHEISQIQEQLAVAEERLRSDVYQKYAESTVELDVLLKDRRLLVDHVTDKQIFLPTVAVGDKFYLISDFRELTGTLNANMNYEKVYELGYSVSLPEAADGTPQQASAIRIVNDDSRVGMVEVPKLTAGAMRLMTLPELKKRGIQELYLFKTDSFGKRSAPLDVRCSMSMATDDGYLYIRNATNVSGAELKAEIGDIVMTKQGDFVGVVVAIENFDLNRKQEAKCFVFPNNPAPDQYRAVSLERDGEFFSPFCQILTELQSEYKTLNAKTRQR